MGQPISSLESLKINGVKQWILLQSSDQDLPVLLILHGGPGYAMMPLFHHSNQPLEDSFLVVNWDQRGAGRSYSSKIPRLTMVLDWFVKDLQWLTDYLKTRFVRQKIYLLGHSWGTLLGLLAAHASPGDYHAFCGVGQVVNLIQNEIVMYDWTLAQTKASGDAKAIKQLERIGRPDSQGEYPHGGDKAYNISEKWMNYFGGELWGKQSDDEIVNWLFDQPEYQGKWGKKWKKGWDLSQRLFDDPAVWNLDFPSRVPSVNLPVYFFAGRHDYDTPHTLVEQYFKVISAPDKDLFWFDHSAHFPFYEEPTLFNQALIGVRNRITP
jgi:pimeloyl-ACP methyl ester carboxylesterase